MKGSDIVFFPNKIRSIRKGDLVLEVGPGSTPHPRADVFLEKSYADERTHKRQNGDISPITLSKRTVHYTGGRFPFKDKEFDYVICSHVLEHVPDPALFISELQRVAPRGYIEFPTVYYDHIYNIDEHINLLCEKNDTIHWMPKQKSGMNALKAVSALFMRTLEQGHDSMIKDLPHIFFQGFEWTGTLKIKKTTQLKDLLFSQKDIVQLVPPKNRLIRSLKNIVKRSLGLPVQGK